MQTTGLVSLLLKAGAPLLADIVKTAAPAPVGAVVGALADAFSTQATVPATWAMASNS